MRQHASYNPDGQIIGFERMLDNPITATDSYKVSHWGQYPKDVTSMYSYFESRGGRYASTCFFGLQYYLLHYLLQPITKAHVDEADIFFQKHGEPFNREGWEYLIEKYNGRFPVRIRAVPEGTVVPTGNLLFDIELTTPDHNIFWVVSWLETLLVQVWYPTTVASLSRYCKTHILDALDKSSDDPLGEVGFKLHDFGARGGSSQETIRVGGAAHLVNFQGSDTVEGIRCANHYYFNDMAAFSIPAAEHSTMSMWGREHEEDAYANMTQRYLIDRKMPAGVPKIAACVSDTWDIYNAIENLWCGSRLHPMVRDSGGKMVIRPDSGSPVEVDLKCLQILDRKIGTRKNLKGFKVLPSYFGIIQGDGITDETIPEILHETVSRNFSVSSIGFGMGGGLLQQVNRDTQKFAFKCAAALLDGTWVDVSKDPVTDSGKRSKKGHLALVHENGQYTTVRGPRNDDVTVLVYDNGKVLKTYTLDEVRANAMKGLV
jgi:nicotinamide phosphoribosyltransferase